MTEPGAPLSPKDARTQARAQRAADKASRPWVMRHKILTGLGALIVLIIIISVAASGGGKKNNNAGSDANTTTSTNSGSTSTKGSSSSTSGSMKTIARLHGQGDHTTQEFTVSDSWDMLYSYDCSAFGQQGNFIVTIKGHNTEVSLANGGVNQLGEKGADTEHYHHGGTYYLEVNSECSWQIIIRST